MAGDAITVEANLSVRDAADWFCSLDSGDMADFLQAVAVNAKRWAAMADNQWCVTMGRVLGDQGTEPMPEAAAMIRSWTYFLNPDGAA